MHQNVTLTLTRIVLRHKYFRVGPIIIYNMAFNRRYKHT